MEESTEQRDAVSEPEDEDEDITDDVWSAVFVSPEDMPRTYPLEPSPAMNDAALLQPWHMDLSPVCTWCRHWTPGGGHYCTSYPEDEGKRIPIEIWYGRKQHLRPVGGECKDGQTGKPILFAPDAEVERSPLNEALLDAYSEAAAEARDEKPQQ